MQLLSSYNIDSKTVKFNDFSLTQYSTMILFEESRFKKENEFRNSNYIFGGYRPLLLLMKYKIFPHHK